MSKYRIFLFYQQIGKAPAKGIVSWKLSRCRWICLCLDVIRQMSYVLNDLKIDKIALAAVSPRYALYIIIAKCTERVLSDVR